MDYSQVCIANLMQQLGNHTNTQLEEPMLRHMILNSIRAFNVKFKDEFGEMIIACDSTHHWRKQIFPYYKANRKRAIEKSELDWKMIFDSLTRIREELKAFSPYKVLDVETAEADDIIATLVQTTFLQKILILSSDKDFIQLHTHSNVSQYDPVRKKWITNPDPRKYLKEHILNGDKGDGVPNVLSADNCLVIGERQKSMTKKRLDELMSREPTEYIENIKRNYSRNEQLIDLGKIPDHIKIQVDLQFSNQMTKDSSGFFSYLAKNKLNKLLESMNDFY
jgi:5'-3' exonuclease